MDQNRNRITQLQFLPGPKNYYWNEERLMSYIILISIVIGYILFLVNELSYSIENWGYWVPIVITTALLSTVTNQLLASFRNPGIIHRNLPQDEIDSIPPPPPSSSSGNENDHDVLVDVRVDGKVTKLKYCRTCSIVRPPRAFHCKYCGYCVYRFDHHCPYIGNCIGLKNYGNFYFFLFSVVSLTLVGFIIPLFHLYEIKDEVGSWSLAINQSPISLIVVAASFAGGIFPLGLLIFHTFILGSGITSRELIKSVYRHKKNPYATLNPLRNCFVTICKTRRPRENFELIHSTKISN